jgi:putative 4-mercaptohistidine N1-methyltranferase
MQRTVFWLPLMNPYETEKLLAEYLLFHYGTEQEILPERYGGVEALFYPVRCVTECVEIAALRLGARALDLGCAVGRSTFELARWCGSAVGIDFSHRFIGAAEAIRRDGMLAYERTDEGALTTPLKALLPDGVDRGRVSFEQGDAMSLRSDLGQFDVVVCANLIDRLHAPLRCLQRLPELVKPGGQLVITSPYTWLEEYTPRPHWVGGFDRSGHRVTTLEGLTETLGADFVLTGTKELPFLMREHARKYQLSVAEASLWRRK